MEFLQHFALAFLRQTLFPFQIPCLEWAASSWSECSTECGTGTRHRQVTCPQENQCSPTDKPVESESCMDRPCVRWTTGPWSMCTKSCGSGYQIRYVRCVEGLSGEPSQECPQSVKPPHKRGCNENKCPHSRRGGCGGGDGKKGKIKNSISIHRSI